MSILPNALLLLFSVTLPQANMIVTRHVSDLKKNVSQFCLLDMFQALCNFYS